MTTMCLGQDRTGERFGTYEVLRFAGGARACNWLCVCRACGKETSVRLDSLLAGRQCKCVANAKRSSANNVHGMYKSGTYATWAGMKQRCCNPKNQAYYRYGGRGITICSEWLNSFEAFFAAVGPRPSSLHSIERIDNSRGYCPGNVKWATAIEQQQNMRTNRRLTCRGKTLVLTEWSRVTGIKLSTICRRLSSGWTVEEALESPVRRVAQG